MSNGLQSALSSNFLVLRPLHILHQQQALSLAYLPTESWLSLTEKHILGIFSEVSFHVLQAISRLSALPFRVAEALISSKPRVICPTSTHEVCLKLCKVARPEMVLCHTGHNAERTSQ